MIEVAPRLDDAKPTGDQLVRYAALTIDRDARRRSAAAQAALVLGLSHVRRSAGPPR